MATVAELDSGHPPQWCPGCVLPGALIQKNPSIEKIEDIREGDMVLGSDGKYHKVTEVFAHRHEGKMYRIKSRCLGEVTLTDEHPVLSVERKHAKMHNKEFELKWVRADKLKKGDYVAYPILREEEDLDEIALPNLKKGMDRKSKPFPAKIKIDEDFLLLCGYYLAEGHIHNREVVFTFNSKEQQFAKDVRKAAERVFGLPSSIKTRESKHTSETSVSSTQFARHFEAWFGTGAAKKKIPRFLMLLPKEKQKWLIRGMWRGDGWVGKGKAHYKTVSRTLAEQLKVLLVRQQIVPTFATSKAQGIHRESYALHVANRRDMAMLSKILGVPVELRAPGKAPSSIVLTEFVLTPIAKIETFDYDGAVHNMEVEGVHSYVGENAALHNCGNFGILLALRGALARLSIPPEETVIVSGVGCGSKIPHFVRTYGFEGLHGRTLPPATGIHLVNNRLTVIAVGGDGDGYGIGMGHFIHTMRRNLNICYVVQDNEIYGLTTGQTSPTTKKGVRTKSTPNGSIANPVKPLVMSLAAGATFVARGFAGDIPHLTDLIAQGISHRGVSHIDVLQPCVTWRKDLPYELYQKMVYKLEAEGHDPADFGAAMRKAQETERWPIGVFYKVQKPVYADEIPFISDSPLVKHDISNVDISAYLKEFM